RSRPPPAARRPGGGDRGRIACPPAPRGRLGRGTGRTRPCPGALRLSEGDHDRDIAALAKGGRTNFLGFLLRLAARLPFLFIAGRLYGAEALGRFAYALVAVELASQLACLGQKRGLAQQLSREERPDAHVVADGMLLSLFT